MKKLKDKLALLEKRLANTRALQEEAFKVFSLHATTAHHVLSRITVLKVRMKARELKLAGYTFLIVSGKKTLEFSDLASARSCISDPGSKMYAVRKGKRTEIMIYSTKDPVHLRDHCVYLWFFVSKKMAAKFNVKVD